MSNEVSRSNCLRILRFNLVELNDELKTNRFSHRLSFLNNDNFFEIFSTTGSSTDTSSI
ncbi:hypothetical protein WICANDRAFT_97120, partial [Wickerhamomyces anomalus NRRL Y-366-8]